MAVADLNQLYEHLPEVFEFVVVPNEFEENWTQFHTDEENGFGIDDTIFDEGFSDLPPEIESTARPSFGDAGTVSPVFGRPGSFPGAPEPRRDEDEILPPDCLAFYLPFHFYYPENWGIYLIHESVELFAHQIEAAASGILTIHDARDVARVFCYGHEMWHHRVESFATRLEVTHRAPLYRMGIVDRYKVTYRTKDCLEEALAMAHGYMKVRAKCCQQRPEKLKVALSVLELFIKLWPPGHREGLKYLTTSRLRKGENALCEEYHRYGLPDMPAKDMSLWDSHAYKSRGIGNVNSRITYLVNKNTALSKRIATRAHPLSYRELTTKLEKVAGCAFVRYGKGSHAIWSSQTGKRFVVPRHRTDLKPGTLRSIMRDAGLSMSISEFAAL
jgi:predicted RNA binding protein YcfA (HicA-like mRNA interferase family)